MLPADFLRLGFGKAKGLIALWRLDSKATSWVKPGDDRAVDQFVASVNSVPTDAYFGVGLMGAKQPGRGAAADVVAVPWLWADIDYAGKPTDAKAEHSKKKNYPTAEAAEKAIAAMPVPPSLRVLTGGGVHVYWLFDEIFKIETEADRTRIADAAKAWQGMLKARLIKLGGYGLDSTFDIARVLRLPGTRHTKHEAHTVRLDPDVDPERVTRYRFAEIERFLQQGAPVSAAVAPPKAGKGKPAKVAPSAAAIVYATTDSEPPGEKLYNLAEASQEFKALWDGKTTKPSPSEYDMSLANYAINAGWSDQEAAALLVAFARKKHPAHIEKLLRVTGGVQDYLKLTIGKAHDRRVVEVNAAAAEQAIDELAIEVRQAAKQNREPSREIVLSMLEKFLSVKVIGFRQTGRREEVYSLIVRLGERNVEVILGGASAIHSSPQRLCERLMAEAGRFVPVSKKLKSQWGAILAGLISIREFHDVQEAELADRVKELVEEHLLRHAGGFHAVDAEARAKFASQLKPFIEGTKLHVAGTALKKLATEVDRGIASSDLYIGLKQAGFAQTTIQIPARHTSKSYWVGDTAGFLVSSPPDPTPIEPGSELRRRAAFAGGSKK